VRGGGDGGDFGGHCWRFVGECVKRVVVVCRERTGRNVDGVSNVARLACM
jgi:hypothetical protein